MNLDNYVTTNQNAHEDSATSGKFSDLWRLAEKFDQIGDEQGLQNIEDHIAELLIKSQVVANPEEIVKQTTDRSNKH